MSEIVIPDCRVSAGEGSYIELGLCDDPERAALRMTIHVQGGRPNCGVRVVADATVELTMDQWDGLFREMTRLLQGHGMRMGQRYANQP